jgi:hypothetical protein
MAMGRLEVVPFSEEHLEDAARLLAARHARHRKAEPLLPARFEAPLASHFWPKRGFRPAFYRLYRSIP